MENKKIPQVSLGKTGIDVSKLCFGTLTLSPLQRHLSIDEGAALLGYARDNGITFFDTAELYQNYTYLKKAFERKDDVVIATKSYSYDQKTAQESLDKARLGMNRDVIDIFMLHEQEGELTLKGHREAIDYFIEQKQRGVIKAFGISTHHIAGVEAAAMMREIDVIHPIMNLTGIGIADGTRDEMSAAIMTAHEAGKGIYAMKPLGGGHLIQIREQALAYALAQEDADAIALGMQSEAEVRYNAALFSGILPKEDDSGSTANQSRRLLIHADWCTGCGTCVTRCAQKALSLKNNVAVVDMAKCVLCSYCAADCPVLAIKII